MADATHREPATLSATRVAWNAAYTEYSARLALHEADLKFGELKEANGNWSLFNTEFDRVYGRDWREKPEAVKDHDIAWTAMTEAERINWKIYGAPYDDAIVALLNTPAPDMEAVHIKVGILSTNNFDLGQLGRPGPLIIAQDVERLTGIVA